MSDDLKRAKEIYSKLGSGSIRDTDSIAKALFEERARTLKEQGTAHMCRDGHDIIRHNDSEHEMCPLCRSMRETEIERERTLNSEAVQELLATNKEVMHILRSGSRIHESLWIKWQYDLEKFQQFKDGK